MARFPLDRARGMIGSPAQAGDPDVPNLWAGIGWRGVTAEPAADIVRRIAAGVPQ